MSAPDTSPTETQVSELPLAMRKGAIMVTKINCFLRSQSGKWSKETLYKYDRCLKDFANWLGDHEATEKEVVDWLEDHKHWGPSSKNVCICSLRSFFRWHVGEANSPMTRIPLPRRHTKPQRTLRKSQVIRILASIDTSRPKGVRDTAIILVMLDSGLRSSELCRLSLDYLDLGKRRFVVRVKGGRWEDGGIGEYTASMLRTWLNLRDRFANANVRAVFVSLGGNSPGEPLTRYGLTVIFRYIGKRAGIYPFSPHDLRRTFATLSLKAGAPSRLLQIAGRWKSLKQVENYTRSLDVSHFDPYFPSSYVMGLNTDPDS